MNNELKIQVWGNKNKIVKENLEDIDNTALKKVYKNADRCLYEILSEGQNSNQRDEQVVNVISFLGKRGRGKTSAMLSFHTYLKNMSETGIPSWSKLQQLENRKLVFHTIDNIDSAMLAKNEFVIDVILAKMWDKFNELLKVPYYNDKSNYDYLIKKVQDEFVKVRKAYLTMKDRENNFSKEIEKEREIPAARGLHELATGINLKDSMKSLVENYIQVFNDRSRGYSDKNGYLVLAIDDVDTANSSAWNILEQIRMYMSIPNVIILLASDMGRLRDVCQISQNGKLSANMVSEFINDYLEKVMPVNMRINMPELLDNQTDVCIEKNDYFQWESKYEKDIILELIAKNCEIYFAGKRRKRHFMQSESLRSLVVFLNEIAQLENYEYSDWLKKDLQERHIEKVKDTRDKLFLKNLYNIDYKDINNYVINYLNEEKGVDDKNYWNDSLDWLSSEEPEDKFYPTEYSMGRVLYLCSLLEERIENTNFINCILLFYSLMLFENMKNQKIRKCIIGDSVFGGWEYAVIAGRKERTSEISGFENRVVLQFKTDGNINIKRRGITRYIEDILKKEKNKIVGWLYAMMYVDIKIPTSNYIYCEIDGDVTQDKEGKKEQKWNLKPYISCQKGLFAFMHKDLSEYKTTLKLLFKSLISKFYWCLVEECRSVGDISKLNTLIERNMYIVDEINWGTETDNSKLLVSTEILYCIGQLMEEEIRVNQKYVDGQMEKIHSTYEKVCEYLKEVDKYYREDVHINTLFAENFKNALQVKIFLDENEMSEDVKVFFKEYICKIYRGNGTTVSNSPK